jgi:hypothetical protein
MNHFCIPWPCLGDSPKPPIQPEKPSNSSKTFAQTLSNVCHIPLSQFPQACVKGDRLAIPIPEDEYSAGMDACKHNLHGRIVWPKGTTPLTVVAVKNKLTPLWKDLARWGITSLGKGYYEFSFSSLEYVRRVRSVASWNLGPGYLKLFAWSGDFNPNLQRNTTAQVWVRIYGLSQEYWRPNILFAIASSVGTPICTDAIAAKPMFERTFGHFARVLVDMDLTQTLRNKVLVERKGYAFFVELDYENLPDFCTHCKMVGHYLEICKKIQGTDQEHQPKEIRQNNKKRTEVPKQFVQVNGGRIEKNKTTEVIMVEESFRSEERIDKQIEVSNSKKNVPDSGEQATTVVQPKNNNDLMVNQNMFSALQDLDLTDSDAHLDLTQGIQNVVTEEDTSTQDSEFVDATQSHLDDDRDSNADDHNQGTSNVNVQKDMQFLKESWANMAENEEQEQRLLAALDKGPAPSNFKMVNTKSRKKASKTPPNSIYGTRSKVGPSKPSK